MSSDEEPRREEPTTERIDKEVEQHELESAGWEKIEREERLLVPAGHGDSPGQGGRGPRRCAQAAGGRSLEVPEREIKAVCTVIAPSASSVHTTCRERLLRMR